LFWLLKLFYCVEFEYGYYVARVWGPKAEFTAIPDTGPTGESIKFDASASLPGWNGTHEMPIIQYGWNFGDGNNKATSTPIAYHSFSSSGIYYVTLTVYAPGATPETDTITHEVTIIPAPVGGYSFPIKGHSTPKPLTLYLTLVAILTVSFTMIKRKTRRRIPIKLLLLHMQP
jgi:PKD repeat protein